MKIGFEDTPAAPAGTYSRHLAELLAEYAPEHEYIVDGARYKEFDLYHGFRPGLPLPSTTSIFCATRTSIRCPSGWCCCGSTAVRCAPPAV